VRISAASPIAGYRRHGVRLALGCDNCSCSDVQSIFQVMKTYCLLGGLSDPGPEVPLAAEALQLATVGGARRPLLGGTEEKIRHHRSVLKPFLLLGRAFASCQLSAATRACEDM